MLGNTIYFLRAAYEMLLKQIGNMNTFVAEGCTHHSGSMSLTICKTKSTLILIPDDLNLVEDRVARLDGDAVFRCQVCAALGPLTYVLSVLCLELD